MTTDPTDPAASPRAELEPGDLERLAGGLAGGTVLALWCGLDGWSVTLLATLAGGR